MKSVVVLIPSPWGAFQAHFCDRGLSRLRFPDASGVGEARLVESLSAEWKEWAAQTEEALSRALAGKPVEVGPPMAVPAWATPFQRAVWEALRRIPPGRTCTYGGLAARIGRPRAARAVGQACGANPWPVLVPCHRVLAADGRLGGFSAGLEWKRRLLEAEGAWPTPGRRGGRAARRGC
ncbi:MAG: methylated-DNA--[protein]-cysteine S-methyltransferase [Verrucomicrobia bacterium]|nr:MAG: methylated-DNA--[protein]-cysteine S-methyltransferase [Verrucomicrobiota bacterium]